MRWENDCLHYESICGEEFIVFEKGANIINALKSGPNIYANTDKGDFVFYNYFNPEKTLVKKVVADHRPITCPLCKGAGSIVEI